MARETQHRAPAADSDHGPFWHLRLGPGVAPVAAVVVLGTTMGLLDSTIVNVALHPLSVGLRSPLGTIQWVASGYLLAVAVVIPGTGWLAQRFGAWRVYLTTVALFAIGSALCGIAGSAGELIAFRVFQGVGGGMTLPVGQIILVRRAGPQNMARVMSLVGIPIVMAPVLGPTIGGLVIDNLGWRWIFYINLPISIAAFVLGLRLLPKDPPQKVRPLDFPGLALAAGGTVAITYGLADIANSGHPSSPSVIGAIAGGIVLLAIFVAWALRVSHPILDIRLFRDKTFTASAITILCIGAALYGGSILMPLYYQTVRLESVVMAGLLLGPSGIGAAVASWWTGRLTDRFGAGLTVLLGCAIAIAATVPFGFLGWRTSFVLLCVATTFRGFGIGLALVPSMTAAYRALPRDKVNDATPQLSVLRQVGGSLGTALFVVILAQELKFAGASLPAQGHAYGLTFWWVIIVTAVAAVPAAALAVFERRNATARPPTGVTPTPNLSR
jgi:EmrB/QacA subfamily drug resistance transporter